jgi:YVTN family beta-propeller protein
MIRKVFKYFPILILLFLLTCAGRTCNIGEYQPVDRNVPVHDDILAPSEIAIEGDRLREVVITLFFKNLIELDADGDGEYTAVEPGSIRAEDPDIDAEWMISLESTDPSGSELDFTVEWNDAHTPPSLRIYPISELKPDFKYTVALIRDFDNDEEANIRREGDGREMDVDFRFSFYVRIPDDDLPVVISTDPPSDPTGVIRTPVHKNLRITFSEKMGLVTAVISPLIIPAIDDSENPTFIVRTGDLVLAMNQRYTIKIVSDTAHPVLELLPPTQDFSGNVLASSDPEDYTWIIETGRVRIDDPAPDDLIASSTVEVSGVYVCGLTGADADKNVTSILVNGIPAEMTDGYFTPTEGYFTATLTGLDDGPLTITAEADAADGNAGYDQIQVFIDTTPPTIAITDPADGSIFGPADDQNSILPGFQTKVTISTDADDGQIATLVVDGDAFTSGVAGGTATFFDVTLTEGPNTLLASVSDLAGNLGTSAPVRVTVDTLAPTVSISSPTGGCFTSAQIIVEGIYDDVRTGVSDIKVNGITASFSAGSFSATLSLPQGVATIIASAVDAAENDASSDPVFITIDTIAPLITITYPPDLSILNSSDDNDSDPSNGLQTDIKISTDAEDGQTVTLTVNNTSTYQVPVIGGEAIFAYITIPEGNNIHLTAIVSDVCGNISSPAEISIYVDIQPPVITDTTDFPNDINGDGPYTIFTTITDNIGLATSNLYLYYSIDEAPFQQIPLINIFDNTYRAIILPAATLDLGTKVQYYIFAGDLAGNTSTDPAGVMVSFSKLATNLSVNTSTEFTEASGTGEPFQFFIISGEPLAYITNDDSSVTVVDTGSKMPLEIIKVGKLPTGLRITPDDKRVYISNSESDTVSVIDTATNSVIDTINVGDFPIYSAITPDGEKLYVSNSLSGTISVIETETNTVVKSINMGGIYSYPHGIAITPDGARAYVARQFKNDVLIIDTSSDTVIDSVTLGIDADLLQLAISPKGDKAYVASTGYVSIIIIPSHTVSNIPVSSWDLAFNFSGSKVYATSLTKVHVFNAIDDIWLGIIYSATALGIDISSVSTSGEFAYVVCVNKSRLLIFDTITDDLVGTIYLPESEIPRLIAIQSGLPLIINTTELPDTKERGPFTVTATITDNSSIVSATLKYQTAEQAEFTEVPLSEMDDDLFAGSIPWQSADTTIDYYIEAEDDVGNLVTDPPVGTFSFFIDSTAPSVSIVSPLEGAYIYTSTVVVDGSVSEPQPSSGLASVTVNGITATIQGDTFTATLSGQPEAPLTIAAIATDSFGNSAMSAPVNVVIIYDTTLPSIAITSPADGVLLNTSNVLVVGTVTDDNTGVALVMVNGVTAFIIGENFSALLETQPEGPLTIIATATDNAGNSKDSLPVNITIDSISPVVIISSPTNGDFLNSTTVVVTGMVSDPEPSSGIASVVVNGEPALIGTFTVTLTDQSEGSLTIIATATDNASNSTDSAPVNVTIDVTSPIIAITGPADGSFQNSTTIIVTGTVSDPPPSSGIASVIVNGVSASFNGGSFTATLTGQPEGSLTIIATATDNASNSTESLPVIVTVDFNPPAIDIASPATGSVINTFNVSVQVNYSDTASGINPASLTVLLDGADITSLLTVTVSGATGIIPVTEGSHTLTAAVSDNAGNPGAALSTFAAVVPPVINIIQPANFSASNSPSQAVVIIYSDIGSGLDLGSLIVELNGVSVTSSLTITAGTASGTVTATLGGNLLSVSISDNAGNVATATSSFAVDNLTPPSISIIQPTDGSTVLVSTPLIQIALSDAETGVDLSTLSILINGVEMVDFFTITSSASLMALFQIDGQNALPNGPNNINASVSDLAGNPANTTSNFFVNFVGTAPWITEVNPDTGTAGVIVTIEGGGFDPTPANNLVTFNGVTALVTAASATSLTTEVPVGASTGPLLVDVDGVKSNSVLFTVALLYAYITNRNGDTVSAVNMSAKIIDYNIPVGTTPWGAAVSPDGRWAFVANRNSNDVSIIDTITNTEADMDPVTPGLQTVRIPVCGSPDSIAFTPDGSRAYVSCGGGQVSVIETRLVVPPDEIANPADAVTTLSIPAGAIFRDIEIAPDGSRAYIAGTKTSSVPGNVTRLNVLRTEPLARNPAYHNFNFIDMTIPGAQNNTTGVGITPEGSLAYINNMGSFGTDADTAVLETANDTEVDVVDSNVLGSGLDPVNIDVDRPVDTAIHPRGYRAYIAFFKSGNVGVLENIWDMFNNDIIAATQRNDNVPFPREAAFSPSGSEIYVTNYGTDNVMVLNDAAVADEIATRVDLDVNPLSPSTYTYIYGFNGPEGIGIQSPFDSDLDGISNLIEARNVDNLLNPVVHNWDPTQALGDRDGGSLFQGVLLPEEGMGYRHNYGTDSINFDNWGTLTMLKMIEAVGRAWLANHPNGPRITINDISKKQGGKFGIHDEHQNGLDVDVRYVRNDGSEGVMNFDVNPGDYDQALTEELVNLFIDHGAFKILVDEDGRSGLTPGTIIQLWQGHQHHFHVSIPDPD